MAVKNHLGLTIYVSAALPATNDAAGFEALTWAKASNWVELPQLGVSHETIDVPDGESGFTAGVKGAGAGVDTTMAFSIDGADAGQTIIRTQADDQGGDISVKIVRGSGTDNAPVSGDPVEYAKGFAHSYQENQGTTSSYEGFTAGFRQNGLTVKDTEPA